MSGKMRAYGNPIYDGHMITVDECGPNFLTFVFAVEGKPRKNSTRKLALLGIEHGFAGLVGSLPRVSYVCLVGQSLKGRWWERWWSGGTPGAVQQISWHLPYDWGKPRKTSDRKPSAALSRATSHCLKRSSFSPNEVGRAMLPAPLAKPIGSSQTSVMDQELDTKLWSAPTTLSTRSWNFAPHVANIRTTF